MGKQCRDGNRVRDWLKEEMMAYLDWDKNENERIEGNIAAEMDTGLFSDRRGMRDIWDEAERDSILQSEIFRKEAGQ